MSRNGKGAISDRHYLAHSCRLPTSSICDGRRVLAVGTRFDASLGTTRQHRRAQDPDPARYRRRRVRPQSPGRRRDRGRRQGGSGRADRAGRALQPQARPSRAAELTAFKERPRSGTIRCSRRPTSRLAIRAELPDDRRSSSTRSPRSAIGASSASRLPAAHLLTSGYQGTLGYGFTTALGARSADPDVPVVSINGDGGFMLQRAGAGDRWSSTTSALIAIVFNDGAYGNVKPIQAPAIRRSRDRQPISSIPTT